MSVKRAMCVCGCEHELRPGWKLSYSSGTERHGERREGCECPPQGGYVAAEKLDAYLIARNKAAAGKNAKARSMEMMSQQEIADEYAILRACALRRERMEKR